MTAVVDPLCELPEATPDVCCDPLPPLAAPILKHNARGLPSLRYRIGTFTSFRRAMLNAITRPSLLDDLLEPGRSDPNPFIRWQEGNDGDYQTAFVELWAYLADILTFYQERIANEAYIRTAEQRASAIRLAELVGHRASPGAAANALIAFVVEPDRIIDIPAGFRVGGKPGPGGPPPVFETARATTTVGSISEIALSSLAPTNQFAALASYGIVAGLRIRDELRLATAAAEIYGAAGTKYLKSISSTPIGTTSAAASAITARPFGGAAAMAVSTSAATASGSAMAFGLSDAVALKSMAPSIGNLTGLAGIAGTRLSSARRRVVLAGVASRLSVGDDLLIVENEGTPGATTSLRRVVSLATDARAKTTTIAWDEPAGVSYRNVTLYALRVKAAPFGSNAAEYATLPPSITKPSTISSPVAAGSTTMVVTTTLAPYPENWDDPARSKAYMPTGRTVNLDATYEDIAATPTQPSWVVLVRDAPPLGTPAPSGLQSADGKLYLALRVTDAAPVTVVGYAMTARVTRLTVSASLPTQTFPIRTAVVLAGAVRLTVQPTLPLPERVTGTTLLLEGLHPDLRDGQNVIVRGQRFDPSSGGPARASAAEGARLAGPPELDRPNGITQIVLETALGEIYARSTTKVLANVVEATHGETVRDEVLGSGDARAGQAYPLKKSPLTYLPATGTDGLAATTSTLRVTVNGVSWEERPTLAGVGPGDEIYVTRDDEASAKTTVIFGDGREGAQPPTGRDNIRARYRRGLGVAGNVDPGGLSQLVDNAAGLQRATNPLRTTGGVDPEAVEELKVNAPNSVRTFGRAVSAEDYAALALTYPGIAKAAAVWVRRDPVTYRAVQHPWLQLTVAATGGLPPDSELRSALRRFLDARRDPNVPLRIASFVPVFVDVAAVVDVEDRHPRQATLARVRAAMQPAVGPDGVAGYFAFERLDFDMDLHLGSIHAAIQGVDGVRSARVTILRRVGPPPPDPQGAIRQSILIRPTEIAIIRDHPEDPTGGRLVLELGEGGFVDS